RVRGEGGVSRRVQGAAGARGAGAAARRDSAVRPPVDVARERGGAVEGAAQLVPRAGEGRGVKPWREGGGALGLDTDDRILLVHFDFPPFPWAPPGGGIEAGESDEAALRPGVAGGGGPQGFAAGAALLAR